MKETDSSSYRRRAAGLSTPPLGLQPPRRRLCRRRRLQMTRLLCHGRYVTCAQEEEEEGSPGFAVEGCLRSHSARRRVNPILLKWKQQTNAGLSLRRHQIAKFVRLPPAPFPARSAGTKCRQLIMQRSLSSGKEGAGAAREERRLPRPAAAANDLSRTSSCLQQLQFPGSRS